MGLVSTAFVKQYKDMIILLTQQKKSKLRNTVQVDLDFVGEFKFYDQLGATEMVEKISRNQDTPSIDPDHQRRRLAKRDFLHNTLLDKEDELNMIVDPKSKYAQAASAAAGRQMDDLIINAFNSTAFSGADGSTSVSFDASFQIAVGTSGLTKAKLIEAKELLDDEDVEEEERTCVTTPKQISNLLNTTEATSSDFNTVRALVDGNINTWLGFDFVRISSKRLPIDGNSNRLIYCYHKGAIQLGVQKDPTVRIDERPDKNYATQVFLSMSMDATRLEEERIVQIACSES